MIDTTPAERNAYLDALATGYDCPRCGAYADTTCKTGTGRETVPHTARIDRAVRLYKRTGVVRPLAHTIRNDEIGLSYCGRQLPIHEPTDATPWTVSPTEVGIWDSDETPASHRRCPACWTAYEAACAEIDARNAAADKARRAPVAEAPAARLDVVKGACGTASHWTVVLDGEQVACRATKADALGYVPAPAVAVEAAPEGEPECICSELARNFGTYSVLAEEMECPAHEPETLADLDDDDLVEILLAGSKVSCAVCGTPIVEWAPDRWLHASTVGTAVPERHAADPAPGAREALDKAETMARVTGSVGATYREERVEADGTVVVAVEATWVRPGATTCEWWAACDRPATTTRSHPVLGAVPICGPCDDKVTRLGG